MVTEKKKTAVIVLFIAIGAAASLICGSKSGSAVPIYFSSAKVNGIGAIFPQFTTFCKSVFLQAILIFISGFTIVPFAIDLSIMMIRGFALGNAVLMLNINNEKTVVGFISYLLITLIFIPLVLKANSFRKGLKGSVIRKCAQYSYKIS